jgi:predicted DNA-binding transcriptional regulator YafY
VVEQLHQAFLMMRKIHIHYRDASGEETERAIEPQYLLLSYPAWYAIAWDDLRSEVRIFRCDRIERARLLDEVFRRADSLSLKRQWKPSMPFSRTWSFAR